METHLCQNCGNEYKGEFCNRCGQKTVHRVSLGHIAHEAVHAFTHADKGIIHLFIELFKRPGMVAREYIIEGKRKRYFNPVQYLLIIASIATFVVLTTHLMDHVMQDNPFSSPSSYSKRQAEVTKEMTNFLSKYFNVVLLLQLPLFALGSYIVYRKHKLYYAEHLLLHVFITAQVTVISTVLMVLLVYTKPALFYILPTVASLIYTVIAYRQFFNERSFKGVVKGAFSYALSHLLYFILFTIVLTIVMLIVIKSKMHPA
jgi:hypothetical protein